MVHPPLPRTRGKGSVQSRRNEGVNLDTDPSNFLQLAFPQFLYLHHSDSSYFLKWSALQDEERWD